MALEWEEVVVLAQDPVALGHWWARALEWEVVSPEGVTNEVEIRPSRDRPPSLLFLRSDEPKTGQNRWHPDFVPDDQDAEVERLLALGATRADVGQRGDESWVVLADPEGNELCVLRARPS